MSCLDPKLSLAGLAAGIGLVALCDSTPAQSRLHHYVGETSQGYALRIEIGFEDPVRQFALALDGYDLACQEGDDRSMHRIFHPDRSQYGSETRFAEHGVQNEVRGMMVESENFTRLDGSFRIDAAMFARPQGTRHEATSCATGVVYFVAHEVDK